MISASGNSNTLLLPSDPDNLCYHLKLLLPEKQAGNNSIMSNKEILAEVEKLLEHKSLSKKQHEQTLIKCNLLHSKEK